MKTTVKNLVVFGFAVLTLAGCVVNHHDHDPNADKSVKWEYHTEMMRPMDSGTPERLNQLQSQGWIIDSVTQNGDSSTYRFKRQAQ